MKRLLKFMILPLLSISTAYAYEDQQNVELQRIEKPVLKHIRAFNDWDVYQKVDRNNWECYAITVSYRTKAFEGIREIPFLAIGYKGPKQYTITTNPGYELDLDKGLILKTNNHSYLLNVIPPRFGWTYTSIQDKTIIDEMIKDGRNLTIRSYNTSDDTALDFFSLKGFTQALNYIEKNCADDFINEQKSAKGSSAGRGGASANKNRFNRLKDIEEQCFNN